MVKRMMAVALLGSALGAVPAHTMPTVTFDTATSASVERVAWVCGPVRCFWRPGPAFYGPRVVVGPRFYAGPRYGRWGYRGWRRW
jgi:hypothetical protein